MPLAEFATREKCWACALPPEIRKEMDETRIRLHAQGKKVGPDTVVAWLIAEKGYTRDQIKRGSLNYHFQNRHHES